MNKKFSDEYIYIFGHNPLCYNMADHETNEVRVVPNVNRVQFKWKFFSEDATHIRRNRTSIKLQHGFTSEPPHELNRPVRRIRLLSMPGRNEK
jgi:hypothetical protein